MIRKLLKISATALFVSLLAVAAGLGALVGLKHQDEPIHIAAAEETARALSRNWDYADIKARFLPDIAASVDEASAQRAFNGLRMLGRLRQIETATASAYRADYTSHDGISRRSTITFTAHFDRGAATITATLVTRKGVTMLQHLNVKPRGLPQTSPGRTIA